MKHEPGPPPSPAAASRDLVSRRPTTVELLHEADEREEELAEQAMREKRAYADILWAEEQLSDIRAVVFEGQARHPGRQEGRQEK